MRNVVLKELAGGLWHTTHPDRFKRILELGAIFPVPENPNPDGWKTMDGEPYRFVRSYTRRGQSLRLRSVRSRELREKMSHERLARVGPFREKWESAVWIEIDRELAASALHLRA